MNSTPALGKAKAYIDVETNFAPTQPFRVPQGEDGPFITISRATGTGGAAFAKALVKEIESREGGGPPWTVFDSELVQQMLQEAHLPARLERYLPEDRIPAIVSAVGEILGLHPDLWTLVERTNETMRRLAVLGRAVIVGRGGNFATAGLANGLNIRLNGSMERRASRLAEAEGWTFDGALAHVRKIDTARRDYVLSAFGRDVDDASAYDLVINTDSFSTAEGVAAVLAVLSSRRLVPACR